MPSITFKLIFFPDRGKMCPFCKTAIRFIEINERMDAKVKQFFDIRSRSRILEQLMALMAFQKLQFQNLSKAYNAFNAKYEAALKLCQKKDQESKEINEKYAKALQYRHQIQEQYKQMCETDERQNSSSGYKSHLSQSNSNTSVSIKMIVASKGTHKISFLGIVLRRIGIHIIQQRLRWE